MPAAAVRRTKRTLFGITGLKARVGGLPRRLLKSPGSTGEQAPIRVILRWVGETGTSGGAVKCVEIGRNARGESESLDPFWRWDAKARGANGIRYPGSPGCKHWALGSRTADGFTAAGKPWSAPPGEYGRKAETQRNWRGLTQAVEHVA